MKTFILAIAVSFITITLFAQKEEEYKSAHYYDKKGNRVDGFVNTTRGIFYNFEFKKTLQGEPEKILTLRLTAMVIEQDSFAVISNFNVESSSSEAMINIPVALGKVLETGQVNLYEVTYVADAAHTTMYNATSMASVGPMKGKVKSTFIVQQQGTRRYVAVEVGIDDFIKQMSSFLKMSVPIVERLKGREYSYPKSQQLVRDFNEWYKSR
jgi:hypothetical protein